MVCNGAVLQSPEGNRIVVVLSIAAKSMSPDSATIWQSWSDSAKVESVDMADLKDQVTKGVLVPATGPILALGLAYHSVWLRESSRNQVRM